MPNENPMDKFAAEATQFLLDFLSGVELTKRWPCPHCGRPSAAAPLRLITTKHEDGKTALEGCWYCATVERFTKRARSLLAGGEP